MSKKHLCLFAFATLQLWDGTECFYRPPVKLREGNVFTSVCHYVQDRYPGPFWWQVCLVTGPIWGWVYLEYTPCKLHPQKVHSPERYTPLGRYTPGADLQLWPSKPVVRIIRECLLVFMKRHSIQRCTMKGCCHWIVGSTKICNMKQITARFPSVFAPDMQRI